jgi:hypothetical protein
MLNNEEAFQAGREYERERIISLFKDSYGYNPNTVARWRDETAVPLGDEHWEQQHKDAMTALENAKQASA